MKVGNNGLVSFKSNNDDRLAMMNNFVNTPDSQLKAFAQFDAAKDYANAPTRKVTRVVGNMIPVADTLLRASLTKGDFATKAITGADTAKDWIVYLLTIGAVDKLHNKALQKFPGLRKFEFEHPTFSNIANKTLYVLSGFAGMAVINKLWRSVPGRFDKNGVRAKAGRNWLNSLKIGKVIQEKIFLPFENLVSRHPKAYRNTVMGAGIFLVGLIAKNIYDVAKMGKKSEKTFNDFKNAQLEVSRNMNNQLMSERQQLPEEAQQPENIHSKRGLRLVASNK